jgi:TolC family type I secretion outer membrane protein
LRSDSLGAPAPGADLTARLQSLGLGDAVDIALANNPETAVSWRQARAAAATWAATRDLYLPTLTATVTGGPSHVVSSAPGRVPSDRLTYGPTLSLSWLLADVGGRSGSITAAREALFAADFSHNATLQSVALRAETGFFAFQAGRQLVDAQRASLETAHANLAAAEQRHDVGLATIADVLQARTAVAQAELALQNAEGALQANRAALALVLGLPANLPFEVARDTAAAPAAHIGESVDSLVERAVRQRPDLAAARAQARQANAQVNVARAALLPSLSLAASAGRVYADTNVLAGSVYTLNFGLSIPLFPGLGRQYSVVAAREQAAAFRARAEVVRVQVAAQVFTSYSVLQTATQQVATAARLLASAEQSEEVARGRYQEGVGTILDLLAAQSALADARAQQVQAKWNWYAALAQLAHDVGVLGPHGETPIGLTTDSLRGR